MPLVELIIFKKSGISYKQVKLRQKLENASNFQEWVKLARTLDQIEGREQWKLINKSSLYEYERIEARYKGMREMRKKNDIRGLVHCLRSDLLKNLGGIANPDLYSICHVGTKRLIEKYHNEVIKCIRMIYYYRGRKLSLPQKVEFFAETRHSYGGATFGRFHFGVIKALHEQDLLPRILCGSSVGSIIATYFCTKKYEELDSCFDPMFFVNNPLIKYKVNSFTELVMNLIRGDAILDTQHMKDTLIKNIGDVTFKEIHDKYKWNLNITVTDEKKTDETRLLNYLTAPNVLVWSAVCASTAIPRFYDPVELMIKTESGQIRPYHPNLQRTRYVDGSISTDLPMQRVSELFNVNTFIVSQVNPHVIPFVSVDGGGILQSQMRKRFSITIKALVGNEVQHIIEQLQTLGVLPQFLCRMSNLVTQSYKGHVTIVPQIKPKHYRNLLINPTLEECLESMQSSYNRAVFGVEREFDRYYMRLKTSLRGNIPYLNDKNLIEYATRRTFNRKDAWDELDNELEQLDNQNNELICYISKNHKNTINYDKMREVIQERLDEKKEDEHEHVLRNNANLFGYNLHQQQQHNQVQIQQRSHALKRVPRVESIQSMLSAQSQEFFGSDLENQNIVSASNTNNQSNCISSNQMNSGQRHDEFFFTSNNMQSDKLLQKTKGLINKNPNMLKFNNQLRKKNEQSDNSSFMNVSGKLDQSNQNQGRRGIKKNDSLFLLNGEFFN
ncbi:patatin-like phospholipase family [Stylonychia lemnae]|uniref:Patatin-like phospholipase family n=1 Tax=Stylonychia lemnae TaxID=5949 RepID=A0A077ZU00_STYLE|nr:patatin-like phospholipase family [Stylonychia lemnae]|eukprot:CDW73342.1 patatin-like phospholipase family [Stylonychia lemnae]